MKPADALLLNPRTAASIKSFLARPSHGLMLVGPPGSGKRTVAELIATSLLELATPAALDTYPHYSHVEKAEGKKDIAIETVRDITRASRLKIPGRQAIRRVVFIENAQHLSLPAQNALLKTLEEPSEDTVFILSLPSIDSVQATIASRLTALDVGPVSTEAAKKHYSGAFVSERVEAAWQLSRGQAGLLHALLTDDQRHPLKQAVEEAKTLIRQSPYELIVSLEKAAKDEDHFPLLLDALDRVITVLHHAAITKNNDAQAKRLLAKRKLLNDVRKAQDANANQRLLTLELALNLDR